MVVDNEKYLIIQKAIFSTLGTPQFFFTSLEVNMIQTLAEKSYFRYFKPIVLKRINQSGLN